MDNFTSYKGRVINKAIPVQIYRNLRNGMYSIRQGGLVIGHCTMIMLEGAEFRVSQAGRRRVLKTKHKNVHATVCGHVAHSIEGINGMAYYNPYTCDAFQFEGEAIHKAAAVMIDHNGVHVAL